MSFQCPKCGYREAPIWRHTLRRLYTKHCHISDLQVWEPQLAELLLKKGYVYQDGVKYRLNKSGDHVHKIPAYLCQNPDPKSPQITEPNTEKSKARILGLKVKNQTRLLPQNPFTEKASPKNDKEKEK